MQVEITRGIGMSANGIFHDQHFPLTNVLIDQGRGDLIRQIKEVLKLLETVKSVM